jgi:hypothetical protein
MGQGRDRPKPRVGGKAPLSRSSGGVPGFPRRTLGVGTYSQDQNPPVLQKQSLGNLEKRRITLNVVLSAHKSKHRRILRDPQPLLGGSNLRGLGGNEKVRVDAVPDSRYSFCRIAHIG